MNGRELNAWRPGAWAAAFLALVLLAPSGTRAQVNVKEPGRSQSEIARDLRSADRERMKRALEEVPSSRPDRRGWPAFPEGYVVSRELADALIFALDREARLHLHGAVYRTPKDPKCPADRCEDETITLLDDAVFALRDPASIPALVQTLPISAGRRDRPSGIRAPIGSRDGGVGAGPRGAGR